MFCMLNFGIAIFLRSYGLMLMCFRYGEGHYECERKNETIKEKIRKAFSLSEDSASHEEIR